jgi:hypothetical protein
MRRSTQSRYSEAASSTSCSDRRDRRVTEPESLSPVRVQRARSLRHTMLAVNGVLDGTTYLVIRNAVVKAALC